MRMRTGPLGATAAMSPTWLLLKGTAMPVPLLRARRRAVLAGVSAAAAASALVLPSTGAVAASGASPTPAPVSRPWLDASQTPDQRARELLAQMTLPEKVDLMTGNQGEAPYAFYNAPIVRLGIPALKMADSSTGVHAHGWSLAATGENATSMPSAQALGATWSTAAITPYATQVTREVRNTGQNVLLSPVGDVYRNPWFGRINESPSEDPMQTGTYLSRYTEATQSQHVLAVLKHYLAYTQETNRSAPEGQNDVVDMRTLREIYALPYEIAVKDSNPGAVMCSYNKIDGAYSCENPLTLHGLLKNTLRFTGFVMTDYGAAHTTAGALRGGTDMETGLQDAYGAHLQTALENGTVPETLVDQACYRILFSMFRLGLFDHPTTLSPIDVDAGYRIARTTEEQAITLLKNQTNALPLGRGAKKIAVIGADATTTAIGGGTPFVQAVKVTTPLQGILQRAQSAGAIVRWLPGNDQSNAANMLEDRDMTAVPSSVLSPTNGPGTGLTTYFWTNNNFQGAPVEQRVSPQVNYDVSIFSTLDTPGPSQVTPPPHSCSLCAGSAVYDGHITAPKTGDYQLALTGFGDATLAIDGQQVADMQGADGQTWMRAYSAAPTVHWVAGSTHTIHITFKADHPAGSLNPGTVLLEWKTPDDALSPAIQNAVAAARDSDVAIVYAMTIEGEARDRVSLHLPNSADAMIRAVSAVNPHTIVVLANSGPVTMPWLNKVGAVVETYFGGEAQGAALARVLWGDVNPSGHLTITYPTSDTAVPPSIQNPWEGSDNLNVTFGEGVNVGYKAYLKAGIKPLFPFGYGLSYTSFAYSGLSVSATHPRTAPVHVRFHVRNTGTRSGAEVAQVYVQLLSSTGEARRLVGWAKLTAGAGATATADVTIDPSAPAHPLGVFDATHNQWQIPSGTYRVFVGRSATQIVLTGSFTVS
jgi:beta-glucosidase